MRPGVSSELRRGMIAGAVFAAVVFLGFVLNGSPIFSRGSAASFCYAICCFAFALGFILANLRGDVAPDPTLKTPPFSSVSQADLKAVVDRLEVVEKRLSTVSVAAGLKPAPKS